MLSEANARILLAIRNNHGVVFSDEAPPGFTKLRIDYLAELRYLHTSTHKSSGITVYQLLPAGEDALTAFYEERAHRAAEEEDKHRQELLQEERWRKDARRSWMQWAPTTILAILSFLAGAMAEELTGFVKWISSFFH